MVPLATVLLLHQISGSYAIAGITAALVAAGDAASTPVQGRLVDRLGRGRVLIPTAAVHVAAVAAVLMLARKGAPAAAVAVCACVAGIGMPPVSGSIKAIWPQLVGQDHLPAAYTVESLLQQVIFLSGPAPGGRRDHGGQRRAGAGLLRGDGGRRHLGLRSRCGHRSA